MALVRDVSGIDITGFCLLFRIIYFTTLGDGQAPVIVNLFQKTLLTLTLTHTDSRSAV